MYSVVAVVAVVAIVATFSTVAMGGRTVSRSLSQFTRWLAEQAEEAGVDIFPGMPVSEVLYGDSGEVVGVATA